MSSASEAMRASSRLEQAEKRDTSPRRFAFVSRPLRRIDMAWILPLLQSAYRAAGDVERRRGHRADGVRGGDRAPTTLATSSRSAVLSDIRPLVASRLAAWIS